MNLKTSQCWAHCFLGLQWEKGKGRGRGRGGEGQKKVTEGNGEGGSMKEDPSERKKTSENERTPLIFFIRGVS